MKTDNLYFCPFHRGSYTLTVYHLAYKKIERIIQIHTGDTLHLQLDPALFHSADVVVQSTKENAYSQAQPIPVAVVDGFNVYRNKCAYRFRCIKPGTGRCACPRWNVGKVWFPSAA
jgi:hypothetical protein